MPQTLQFEITDVNGKREFKKIQVIRSWQDSSGALILLFANGSYGYKNGEPVRDSREFDIITSLVQKRAAMAWWQRAGSDMSKLYYEAKERSEAALHGDFQNVGESAEFDAVLYTRESTSNDNDVSGPFSWMDLFQARPDWWGQAVSIRFGDYTYMKAETGTEGTPAMQDRKGEEIKKAEGGPPSLKLRRGSPPSQKKAPARQPAFAEKATARQEGGSWSDEIVKE